MCRIKGEIQILKLMLFIQVLDQTEFEKSKIYVIFKNFKIEVRLALEKEIK